MISSAHFRRSAVALAGVLSLLILASPALAFINTEGLTEQLEAIEEEFSDPLTKLVKDLEKAAGGNADAYLKVTVSGKVKVMWDVPKTAWFYSHVDALASLGIVSGYKNAKGELTGAYGPGDNVLREQAIKIALGSAGVDVATCGGTPANANHSDWSLDYVACAEKMNFGFGKTVKLTDPATRAEVLHYLTAAFKVQVPEGTPPFEDSKKHMYKNDVAYAFALGIVSGDKNADGTPKGTFRADANVNRAEAAKMADLGIRLL